MIAEGMLPSPRRRILFLSFTYPASGGTGAQLRSVALIRMLAVNADVYVVIAGYVERVGGPRNRELEGVCRQIAYLRIRPAEPGGAWPALSSAPKAIYLPTMDCAYGEEGERIAQYYRDHQIDCLFAFRLEALHFLYKRIDSFPVRYLDLDEVTSRREAQISRLRRTTESEPLPPEKRARDATLQILEKVLIPRFHRVFVSSAVEAEEVRKRIGIENVQVLPNVYPVPRAPLEKRTATRNEILFVGTFSYFPNSDAVLYFCREILPLIREKKGDTVLFRIVGMGNFEELEWVKNQPGVELMGYQENLEPFYTQAALIAVPLRVGTGTRYKIIEAFANGRAVVSTSIGAEGLAVTDRKNIMLADTPETFAQACIELIDHPGRAEQIAGEASRLHRDFYSDEALLRCYAEITAVEKL